MIKSKAIDSKIENEIKILEDKLKLQEQNVTLESLQFYLQAQTVYLLNDFRDSLLLIKNVVNYWDEHYL